MYGGLNKRYGIEAEDKDGAYEIRSIRDASTCPRCRPTTIRTRPTPRSRGGAALQDVLDRIEVEMGVIEDGFVDYFLIVGDFVARREQGIACVARGSAAGSLVTYLLEISNVDPLRYGLLFERFQTLNALTSRHRHRFCR